MPQLALSDCLLQVDASTKLCPCFLPLTNLIEMQEPFPQQPIQRPMRAIRGRTARYANTSMDRSEAVAPRDAEGGSPPTPVRRAGRGEPQSDAFRS